MSDIRSTEIHDRDAELQVLSAAMLQPDGLDEGLELLEEPMFTTAKHRALLAAYQHLRDNGEQVNPVAVTAALRRLERLKDVGGPGPVTMLLKESVTTAFWHQHIRRVRDREIARSVAANAEAVLRYDFGQDGPELAEQARFAFETIDSHEVLQPEPAVQIERWRRRQEERRQGIVGMKIGLRPLDKAFGYIRYGDCIVIAGRPGSGKTSLCNTIASALASRGVPVGVLTLEQTLNDWEDRTIAQNARISLELIQSRDDLCGRKISTAEDELADATAQKIADWPLRTIYLSQPSPVKCRAALAALRRDGARVLMLDHLREIDYQVPVRGKKEEYVGRAVHDFRQRTAQRYKVPLLLFHQMNREIEGKRRMPNLGDLRDSGRIEEHADRVLFVHDEGNKGERVLVMAKARGKNPPPVNIGFDTESTAFFDNMDGTGVTESGTASLEF